MPATSRAAGATDRAIKFHSQAGILASPLTGGKNEDVFQARGAAAEVLISPRCYCITSKYPLYKLHFQVLRLVIEADMETRREARAALADQHTHDIDVVLTGKDLGITLCERNGSVHCTRDPHARAAHVLNSIATKQGGNDAEKNTIAITEMTDDRPMGSLPTATDNWAVVVLLRLLSAPTVVKVVSCLLLEKQVAVVSDSTAKLSVVNTALVVLLRPFQWQSTFIPILPSNLLDFLHSPVPYLVGVHSAVVSMEEWPDVCFVHVESDSMQCPYSSLLLSFPRAYDLTKLLHDASANLRSLPPRPGQPWHEVSGDQSTYDVLQDQFHATVVRGSLHPQFLAEFAQTQLFCQYCEVTMNLAM
ncbi:hypothetical protein DYB32_007934 [Aphanomyces invadans]|uniref:UDENN domain-containing protein n=1 Tax=Aphanomyces invadans TaxID=157072 RepID=A0A418B064_9STRA|nr:hypothetical protein DYB32_007934 [Aphanomyces invadans]